MKLKRTSLFLPPDAMERLRDEYPTLPAAAVIRALIERHLREIDKDRKRVTKEELEL